ncbi:nucleotide-binding universal stress UspA family protein [Actinomadura pelletieri DSM 43383]|uniref:Nucleotide-binding universal stress UspA family protein n=1 Tax=Actinomadura pelletieri DSM 43383 TaxID=1120940 RepID=A0A495QX91_9ACTN|nr:universal stress protein [Actinomadura pelletieri]RKS78805.1 nucleotide-binding universal stress UspA family protein [Actinomadura pelletieri DSM 43383]
MAAPIIVGIDGSAHAWRALDWAADHAVRHGLPLRLVHGSRALVRDGTIPDEALRRLVAEREDMLAEARQYALKQHPDLDVETRLVAKDPGGALVDESEHGTLVAVGSRGLGGFEGLLFGSVGLYTAAHAVCPVMVVSRSAPFPTDAPAEIVVGIEGRREERPFVEWAFAEAASRGARILALHAVGGEFGSPRQRVIEDMELSEALAGLRERYPDVPVDQLVSDQTPSRALVDASENAGLVVVGAPRRRGLIGMALGRVNHAVLHHAKCVVAIVPTNE